MVERAVVRRYAGALFAAALRQDNILQVEEDLKSLQAIFRASPRLMGLLSAPLLDLPRKKGILTRVFHGRISPLTERFMLLVMDKHREQVIPEAADEFIQLHFEHRGVKPGVLTVSHAISEADVSRIEAAMGRRFGGTVELEVEVDSELLGGARVVIGDTVVDGSLQGRLRRLRQHLLSGVEGR